MTTKGRYFANRETKIYHDGHKQRDACRETEIAPANRVHFDSAGTARLEGYTACKICTGKLRH